MSVFLTFLGIKVRIKSAPILVFFGCFFQFQPTTTNFLVHCSFRLICHTLPCHVPTVAFQHLIKMLPLVRIVYHYLSREGVPHTCFFLFHHFINFLPIDFLCVSIYLHSFLPPVRYVVRLLCWTDHDHIRHAYADRPENGSYQILAP